jgi:hypothetical protein
MSGNNLPEHVKVFILQAVASFDSPATVAEAVNREFGLKISRQQVEKYDPNKRAGSGLSDKYRTLFNEWRAKCIKDIESIGIANKTVRLRVLNRICQRAEEQDNVPVVLQTLEQAAKETGGLYTNHRIQSGQAEQEQKSEPRFPGPDRLLHLRAPFDPARRQQFERR